jgi:hypothetical protein
MIRRGRVTGSRPDHPSSEGASVDQDTSSDVSRLGRRSIIFALVTVFFALVAHAVAYLTHEYAHTVTAWSLGWMAKPFDVDYGASTVSNVILLGDVSDNVSYDPIFASGHGLSAAVIALAGPFLGNGLLYFFIYALTSTLWVRSRRYVLMFLYWLSLMCAANVWSYVPLRALTTHADIALGARGLGLSTWALFPFVMAVSGWITWHFLTRMVARVYEPITAGSLPDRVLFVAFTAFWYFSFFSGDAINGSYGLLSQILSMASRYLLFPLCAVWLAARYIDRATSPR